MLKTVLIYLLVAYIVLAVYAYLMADRSIFLPPTSSYGEGDLPVRLVETEDGAEVAVLHLPNSEAALTILVSHGNAEDLGHLMPHLERLRSEGFSVLAFDYRGYGMSSNDRPTAEGAYRDAEAVYRHAIDELQIEPTRLVLLGRSVGSGPATDLAARFEVGGLIVESGFMSAFRVITHVPILPFDRFPNLRNISRVDAPVLIVHGDRDEVIHPRHGRRLFAAAHDPKRMLEVAGAGHNNLIAVAGDQYYRELRSFARLVE